MLSRMSGTTARAFLHNRVALVATLVLALVGTSGVVLTGAITTGLIYACVNNSSGTIKIVSASTVCASNEIQLVWYADLTPQIAAEAAARAAADADLQAQLDAEGVARAEADALLETELSRKVSSLSGGPGITIEGEAERPVVTLATGAITNDLLANGSVSPDKLGTDGAALGQVLTMGEGGVEWRATPGLTSLDALSGVPCNIGDPLLRGVLMVTYMPSGLNTIPQLVCEPTTRFTLTVTHVGVLGVGTVSSQPAGISCGNDCAHEFIVGQLVALRATPKTGYEFTGWSGACTGATACSVTMDGDKTVSATFAKLPEYVLTVTKSGNGTGRVTFLGINCGSDCTQTYVKDSVVTLSAQADSGFRFFGWQGPCSGISTCTIRMTQDMTVDAKFATPIGLSITVRKVALAGRPAGGTFTVEPDQPRDALGVRTYAYGETVVIIATPDVGSTVTFSDACAGLGVPVVPGKAAMRCTLTLTANTLVTITFQRTF